ncbi:protein phosphatase 1 regulatory subunit [Oopsacas minuta]|uniref:Protein phosphatase 1 regulatory subunit n=1 Tax=Oopsacas minuta TaxID=111878 RepID=A0AAV7JTU0_9METZ|nr:protein phosphatase 1 regulatory subunit [Oopsacas minuta]
MEFYIHKKTAGGSHQKSITCVRRDRKTYCTSTIPLKLNIHTICTNSPTKPSQKRRVSFDNMTILNAAIREDNIEDAQAVMSSISLHSLNATGTSGISPLHQACLDSNLKMVDLLLKKGVNSSVKDADEWTPLHVACSQDALEIVKLLLEYNADPCLLNLDDEHPTDLTDNEDIKAVLNRHSKSSVKENFETSLLSCLKAAVIEDRVDSFLQTIYISNQGTLLHLSAAYGFKKLATYILENKFIAVDTMDNENWTPLHAAYYWENENIVTLLLKYNANPDLVTKDYSSIEDLKKERSY